MAAGSTYTPIATTTLGSATATITFSSISGSYTDLVIVFNGKGASLDSFDLQFNGDTSSGLYSATGLSGNGSTASSFRVTSQNKIVIGLVDDVGSNTIVSIQNYSNSTTYKTVLGRGNAVTGGLVRAGVGLWRNTNAINQVSMFQANGANFASGSTFTLYGITAA